MNELSSDGKSMCLEALFLSMLFCLFPGVEEGEETLEEGISEVPSGVEVESLVGTDFVSSVGMALLASVEIGCVSSAGIDCS